MGWCRHRVSDPDGFPCGVTLKREVHPVACTACAAHASSRKSDILLSTKNIASGNGQSGYGNLLRSKSCWLPPISNTRSGRGRLLQALTSDSTPCVDSACYRRHRLEKIGRVLEAQQFLSHRCADGPQQLAHPHHPSIQSRSGELNASLPLQNRTLPMRGLCRVADYAGSNEAAPLSWLCCARHRLGWAGRDSSRSF